MVDTAPATGLILPSAIATKADLVNVLRNLEAVLDAFVENSVRQEEGVDFAARADVSSNLALLVKDNRLEVSVETLKSLKTWLNHLKDHAPVVRFTFANDPDQKFLAAIVDWLRKNSGQFVLVRYGIQPSIAAGCLMYTPRHRYDFTLRKNITDSGQKLMEYIRAAAAEPAKSAAPPEPGA
jgi:hypothetical protein